MEEKPRKKKKKKGGGRTSVGRAVRSLNTAEQQELITSIGDLIGKNKLDHEICERLNLTPEALDTLKRKFYQAEKLRFQNLDKYNVFANYAKQSHQMIRELDEVKTKFKNRGQWTALVAAVKTKSEIIDKTIKLGQDLGFIDKKVSELKIEGEMSFSTMSDADIKKEIEVEVRKMHEIAQGKVIEMRPELLGVTDEDVNAFVPANLVKMPERKNRTKIKSKVKVSLKKRV